MDSEIFHANRALLNPKFEGYKLHIIPQEMAVLRFPLANRPTQAATSGKVPFTFQEVQSRITHNHLAVHSESGHALYVDADYNVILIDLGQDRLSPTTRKVYELPKPIQSDAVDPNVHREYPSAAFVSPTLFLVSDGQGIMYVLSLGPSAQLGEAILIGKFVLPSGGPGPVDPPFRIHHVHSPSPLCLIATLSSRYYLQGQRPKVRGKPTPIEFDVWGVKVNAMDMVAVDTPSPVEVLWHRRGEDVPLYTVYDQSHELYLLIGSSDYHELDTPRLPTYEPSPEEIVPIPRADEGVALPNAPLKPPPYSWTQTSDSVTVAIPLPSNTPKTKINVLFSSTTLTVHVELDNSASNLHDVPIPRYSAKALWDGISPSSSFWTFDREAEQNFGILSLHLEKQHEGTRWSYLFAAVGANSEAPEDIEVPETLDPSELWNIREALEKYTAALQGEDVSGLGLGKGIPSLAENEVDEEVDFSIGKTAYITWVSDSSSRVEQRPSTRREYATPFQLLSTPLSGSMTNLVSLIVKSDIDGNVFALDSETPLDSRQTPNWKHIASYPALAFVLASKRDTRFTYHIPGKAVLAFEGGSGSQGSNVYIYYPTASKAVTAKQSILKVNDGRAGALMGVGSFMDANGESIIACLTEGDLILIRGI